MYFFLYLQYGQTYMEIWLSHPGKFLTLFFCWHKFGSTQLYRMSVCFRLVISQVTSPDPYYLWDELEWQLLYVPGLLTNQLWPPVFDILFWKSRYLWAHGPAVGPRWPKWCPWGWWSESGAGSPCPHHTRDEASMGNGCSWVEELCREVKERRGRPPVPPAASFTICCRGSTRKGMKRPWKISSLSSVQLNNIIFNGSQ